MPHDVGDRGVAVAAFGDRGGQPVEQPAAEGVGGPGAGLRRRLRSSCRLPPPLRVLVPTGTVLHTSTVHRSTNRGLESCNERSDHHRTPRLGVSRVRNLPPTVACFPSCSRASVYVLARRQLIDRLTRRHGAVVRHQHPDVRQDGDPHRPGAGQAGLHHQPDELGNVQPNLSRVFGPGSVFALDGDEHRTRRKLLTPPFHGKASRTTRRSSRRRRCREMASWPDGRQFETLEPMMRITLNIILRAIFGADGAELDRLREVIPPWVTLGSRLVVLPGTGPRPRAAEPVATAARLPADLRVGDRHPDRPGQGRRHFDERTDVLSLFLRSAYEDGSTMSPSEIGDELLTLLAAGHETTASTLAWAFERISRHPAVLAELEAEARDRRQRVPPGHHPRGAAVAHRDRLLPDGTSGRRWCRLGQWRDPARLLGAGRASTSCTPTPRNSRTRSGSTRSGSSASGPTCSPGCRSAAAPADASAPRSPTWRWTSSYERCCGTSTIETTTAPRREGALPRGGVHPEGWRPGGHAPPADTPRVLTTSSRRPAWAASSPAAGSGTCSPSGSRSR